MNNLESCACTKYMKNNKNTNITFENNIFSIYGDLNKDQKIILKYYGKLLKENNKNNKIFFYCGYGNLWMDEKILEMTFCHNSDKPCFCIEIELTNVENMYFCFMNNKNEWDLKNKSSYMITINKPITTITKKNNTIIITKDKYSIKIIDFFKDLSNNMLNLFLKIGDAFNSKLKA